MHLCGSTKVAGPNATGLGVKQQTYNTDDEMLGEKYITYMQMLK